MGSSKIREPLTPGHEASGVVAKVGQGVTRVKEGDKVAINPSHPCGKCDNCRDGRENLCREMRFLGSVACSRTYRACSDRSRRAAGTLLARARLVCKRFDFALLCYSALGIGIDTERDTLRSARS